MAKKPIFAADDGKNRKFLKMTAMINLMGTRTIFSYNNNNNFNIYNDNNNFNIYNPLYSN